MPSESPESIALRYQDYCLELPSKEDPFATVLKNIESEKVRESTHSVESLLEFAKSAESDEAKKEFLALHSGKTSDLVVNEVSLYRLISIAVDQKDWKNAVGTAWIRTRPTGTCAVFRDNTAAD